MTLMLGYVCCLNWAKNGALLLQIMSIRSGQL